jgi:hypothetical protein
MMKTKLQYITKYAQSGKQAVKRTKRRRLSMIWEIHAFDPADLTRGTGNKYIGTTPREKIQLPQEAWDRA